MRSDSLVRNHSFRPYDLTVIHSENLPDEYFVISPNGIVHFFQATKQSKTIIIKINGFKNIYIIP